MTRLRPLVCLLASCPLALGGCAAPGPTSTEPELPPIREGTIARLRVDGPNAYINGRLVPGGSYVIDGDTVSTGPRTSVILVLNEGGAIQLDENTDPLFRKGACLLMKILRGKVAFQNMKCQEFEDGLKMAGVAHSYVHILSSENESRVTVITGEVEMRSPSPATLGGNAEYVATADGAVQVLQLTPEQASSRVAWTRNYFPPPAARQSGGISKTGAAVIGVGIGLLFDIFGKDRHRSRPEVPQQVPAPQSPPDSTVPPARTAPRSSETAPQPSETVPRSSETVPQSQPAPRLTPPSGALPKLRNVPKPELQTREPPLLK